MDRDDTIEKLEKLGYSGRRLEAMLVWLEELQTRRTIIECGDMTLGDIAVASIVFDAFNRKNMGS